MSQKITTLCVEFSELPSYNNLLSLGRYSGAAQGLLKQWKRRAAEYAIRAARRAGAPVDEWEELTYSKTGREVRTKHELISPTLFTEPVRITLHIWRPTARLYDVTNPFIKPVLDGFVEAGLLADDSYKQVPEYTALWRGIDRGLKLSPEAEQRQRARRAGRKVSLLTPSRFIFEIALISLGNKQT